MNQLSLWAFAIAAVAAAAMSPAKADDHGGARDCRRKVEMSPVAQSRNDALIGDGHDEHDLDCIPAVKVEQRI